MTFLKQYWTQIRAYLEGLNASQKWAILTTLVLGLLLVGLAVIWAGQPERLPVPYAGSQPDRVLVQLQSLGIDAQQEAGQITVPSAQIERAIATLAQDDLLGADTAEAFNQLIDRQSPWQSHDQNERAYLLAKQRVLGQIISKMRGVRTANVLISMPQNQGFGRTTIRPTASVTIWMQGGGRVGDPMVDAVARLVAGAVAEMKPQNVSVTDANHGLTHTVKDENDVLPLETVELVQHQEERQREKISRVLSYIPGVIVAVNVQLDPVSKQNEVAYDYEDTEPLASEETQETMRRSIEDSGEPGPRPNTGMTIAGGGGSGTEEQSTFTRAEFREKPLILQRQTTLAGHQIRQINVTVNVPRRYFVQIYQASNPDDADPPTDADLQPVVDAQLAQIQAQVEPLIMAEAQGVVRAHMIPDETLLPVTAGPTAPVGLDALLTSGWTTPGVILGLAVLALALMLWMVRRATQQDPLPSVEELAGVPPMLPADEDLVGEAEEHDAPLAGVELNEQDLKSRKIAEQISEMIKANPNEAAGILGRWVRRDE